MHTNLVRHVINTCLTKLLAVQLDLDLPGCSRERVLSGILGSNTVSFLYRPWKFIIPVTQGPVNQDSGSGKSGSVNSGPGKSGPGKSGSDCTKY